MTFWRYRLFKAVQRGSGRVRSPSKRLSPFLTPFTVLNDMRLRAQGGDFALCGARPKGSALWTPAAFEKAGETFPWRLRRAETFS
ncbi:MAG: hypothetical protein K2K34_06880 [Oscillospiraceae bacterium]|nr:hypothetical protein [Oscillospiraceae bacterium]